MIEYKIKEGQEEVKELGNKVIVRTGGEVEFSLRNLENDIIYLNKNRKEVEATIGVKKAIMENVKNSHPHIAEMSGEDLTAAYLYREASGYVNMGEEKLKEIDKQLADYEDEKVEIEKQTGLKSSVELPITK